MYLWLILVTDEDGADDDNEEGIVGDDDGGDKDTVGIENIRKNIQIVEEYRKKNKHSYRYTSPTKKVQRAKK